jgi:hypothetical protein
MKTIKLNKKEFPFKKSAYAYKDFEDRNKRQFNPTLATDLLDYLYSCIQAGYFYNRKQSEIDIVDYYQIIDDMEEINPNALYEDNEVLFRELLGVPEIEIAKEEKGKKEVKKK